MHFEFVSSLNTDDMRPSINYLELQLQPRGSGNGSGSGNAIYNGNKTGPGPLNCELNKRKTCRAEPPHPFERVEIATIIVTL